MAFCICRGLGKQGTVGWMNQAAFQGCSAVHTHHDAPIACLPNLSLIREQRPEVGQKGLSRPGTSCSQPHGKPLYCPHCCGGQAISVQAPM